MKNYDPDPTNPYKTPFCITHVSPTKFVVSEWQEKEKRWSTSTNAWYNTIEGAREYIKWVKQEREHKVTHDYTF